MGAAILNDTTRCVGCGACALACREINQLPGSAPPRQLDANTWTCVDNHGGVFVRRMCLHCQHPTCASVCPVGALHKTPEGPVAYDAGRCIGCRYCIVACPFGIPKYQWDKRLPITQKCVMCYERRLRHGEQPACTQVCPTGATTFGSRDDLIAEARRRIRSNPGRYVNHIFGVREAGGTSVLYLASVPFAELGFPSDLIEQAYPDLTWAIISQVPRVFTVGGAFLFSTAWVVNRRIENARRAKADDTEQP